jgi:hypothetical protein
MPFKKVKCPFCDGLKARVAKECRACLKSSGGILRRFWSHVDKTPGLGPNGDCWFWTGALDKDGYGKGSGQAASTLAHRNAFIYSEGSIPDGLNLCHKCDTPWCVNPGHMFVGTQRENLADMLSKGRHVQQRRAA